MCPPADVGARDVLGDGELDGVCPLEADGVAADGGIADCGEGNDVDARVACETLGRSVITVPTVTTKNARVERIALGSVTEMGDSDRPYGQRKLDPWPSSSRLRATVSSRLPEPVIPLSRAARTSRS